MDASMPMSERICEECEPFVLYRLIDDQDSQDDAILCGLRAISLVSELIKKGLKYDELSSMPLSLLSSQLHNSLAVAYGNSIHAKKHYGLAMVKIVFILCFYFLTRNTDIMF